MREPTRRPTPAAAGARLLAWLLLVALTAGCAQTRDWLSGRRTAEAADPVILGAPETETYLRELHELVTGDPYTQVEIHADAESAATLTPGPQTGLRLGLILAMPGHAETDPARAQSLLREVLASPELLTPGELALATLALADVEARLTLAAEARGLRAENARAQATESRAVAQRIAAVEAENRDLRQRLAEAEEKLEAILSIERSIREQTDKENN